MPGSSKTTASCSREIPFRARRSIRVRTAWVEYPRRPTPTGLVTPWRSGCSRLAAASPHPCVEVTFHYRESGRRIAVLDPRVDASGWLACTRLTIRAMETEDQVFFAAI